MRYIWLNMKSTILGWNYSTWKYLVRHEWKSENKKKGRCKEDQNISLMVDHVHSTSLAHCARQPHTYPRLYLEKIKYPSDFSNFFWLIDGQFESVFEKMRFEVIHPIKLCQTCGQNQWIKHLLRQLIIKIPLKYDSPQRIKEENVICFNYSPNGIRRGKQQIYYTDLMNEKVVHHFFHG